MDEVSLENMNLSTAHTDVSRWSDNEVPSLSIDESDFAYNDDQFYIKETNIKMEKLRKENFDLKLKLYLLENNENFSSNKDLKLKVLHVFDRKDEEINKLEKMLERRNKENNDLKMKLKETRLLRQEHYEEFIKVNTELKGRISESIGIFLKLIDSVEELIKDYRKIEALNNEVLNVDNLSKTIESLEAASRFIINNPEHISEHLDKKKSEEKLKELKENGRQNALNISQIESQEICAKEFLNIVKQFQTLLEDFRANRINYRQFSDKMDPLMDEISKQRKIFENLYLDQLDSNRRLRQLQALLAKKNGDSVRFEADLSKCLENINSMILKAKNAQKENDS